MFFLSNLPSSIHRSSQLRYLLPITLLMCLLSTVIRSKRSKTQSQDILTHAYSFVSEIIQLRKERLVETGHGRNATNSTAQFYFQLYRQAQFKELRLLQQHKLLNDKIWIINNLGVLMPAQCFFLPYSQSLRQDSHHCTLSLPFYLKKIMGPKIKKLKCSRSRGCSKKGF